MFDSPLPISYYKVIATLSPKSNIHIVQHIENKKIYVKKIMNIYNINVYKQLFYNPVINIPRIYALHESDSSLTVIEEYISGETLEEVLNICGTIDETDVINYSMQLCDILNNLHSFNPPIIHRDIKPSNIILTESGQIKLIDLNAAKEYDSGKSKDTILLGTEDFAAPEQFGFASSSPQTDLYSLGVLMNTLLTGETSTEVIGSKRLLPIIRKCLELSPNERYSSALQLKKVLSKI